MKKYLLGILGLVVGLLGGLGTANWIFSSVVPSAGDSAVGELGMDFGLIAARDGAALPPDEVMGRAHAQLAHSLVNAAALYATISGSKQRERVAEVAKTVLDAKTLDGVRESDLRAIASRAARCLSQADATGSSSQVSDCMEKAGHEAAPAVVAQAQ